MVLPNDTNIYGNILGGKVMHLIDIAAAMAAMRHSRIELTMNLYTDPALLDIAGAVNSLPQFGT